MNTANTTGVTEITVPARIIEAVQQFRAHLEALGLVLEADPQMDGSLHRVPVVDEQAGKTGGAYVGHLDGLPAGWGLNYKTGAEGRWKLDGQRLSAEEINGIRREGAKKKAAREQNRIDAAQTAVQQLSYIFSTSQSGEADNHPYFERKGLTRCDPEIIIGRRGEAIIPLVDIHARLKSAQRIYIDGVKRYEKGTIKEDAFFVASPARASMREFFHLPAATRSIFFAEGYATAATIAKATDRYCVACLDGGNIQNVVRAVHEKYPLIQKIICADNDAELKVNKGLLYAQKAAEFTNALVVVPHFIGDEKGTDFNDMYLAAGGGDRGVAHVRGQITQQVIEQTPHLPAHMQAGGREM